MSNALHALQDRLAQMLHIDIKSEKVCNFQLDVQASMLPRLTVEKEVHHVPEMSRGFDRAPEEFRLVPERAFELDPCLEEHIQALLNVKQN